MWVVLSCTRRDERSSFRYPFGYDVRTRYLLTLDLRQTSYLSYQALPFRACRDVYGMYALMPVPCAIFQFWRDLRIPIHPGLSSRGIRVDVCNVDIPISPSNESH